MLASRSQRDNSLFLYNITALLLNTVRLIKNTGRCDLSVLLKKSTLDYSALCRINDDVHILQPIKVYNILSNYDKCSVDRVFDSSNNKLIRYSKVFRNINVSTYLTEPYVQIIIVTEHIRNFMLNFYHQQSPSTTGQYLLERQI